MEASKAFSKAAATEVVLGSNSKVISDDLEKFHHFRGMCFENERSWYDNLVLHWYVAENTAPNAGKIFCDLISGKKLTILSEKKIRRDDLLGLIDDDDRNSLFLCYDLVGTEGSIEIVGAKEDRIDVYDSYRFDATSAIEVKNYTRASAKVIIVDGFIENVAEIHHILQKINEVNGSLLMFARGYSPDVLNTFSVNVLRKTLDVLPFAITLDLGHVNDLYDLSVLTGAEVISSEKGQLISSAKFESLPSVTSVKYNHHEKMLVMRNDGTRSAVAQHLKKLKERLETVDSHNAQELISRIRRMTSLICILTLQDNPVFERRKINLKRSSRLLDHYARYGVCVTQTGTFPKSSWDIALKHFQDVRFQSTQTVILDF